MANPIKTLITLAKKGDRRVLLGGAAVIGGGIGLVVYLHNQGGVAGAFPTLQPAEETPAGTTEGSTDLSSLLTPTGDLSLPSLPDLAPAGDLTGNIMPPNFGGTEPITLPELADLIQPPAYYPTLPQLPQPPSYTGGDYGNDLGGVPQLTPGIRPPATIQPITPYEWSALESALNNVVSTLTPAARNYTPTIGGSITAPETASLESALSQLYQSAENREVPASQKEQTNIAAPNKAQPTAAPITGYEIKALNQAVAGYAIPTLAGSPLRAVGETAREYANRVTQVLQQAAAQRETAREASLTPAPAANYTPPAPAANYTPGYTYEYAWPTTTTQPAREGTLEPPTAPNREAAHEGHL
jgi:hypothetical protein